YLLLPHIGPSSALPRMFYLFYNAPPPTYISPLSLHDALPICARSADRPAPGPPRSGLSGSRRCPRWTGGPRGQRRLPDRPDRGRSEEHTSELQSLTNLVCRLLLEKKKRKKTRDFEQTTEHTSS